jgi:hypothetical protein
MATTATLTVQGILDALDSSSDVLPVDALEQAIARWDEVAPVLVPCIEAYADGRDRSGQAIDLAFFGLYLMAQQRDTRAFRLLCTLLLDPEASEVALSDAVTDEVPSMLVRTYDGDPAPLRTLIEAPEANEEGRETAFEVLAWLTAAGRIDRDETARYLHDLFNRRGRPMPGSVGRVPSPILAWMNWSPWSPRYSAAAGSMTACGHSHSTISQKISTTQRTPCARWPPSPTGSIS